ncbi:MAG: nucleotidyltransferase domain-containing protein [Candidatus Omnitrophica bacterium]|nr:nucleotidyltransferase domain-containing protein [Candidatus Omnitrophota bacterium]
MTAMILSRLTDPKLLRQIVRILLKRKPVSKVVLFGSRARGDATTVSDLDIAIFDRRWTDRDVNLAKQDLEEMLSTPLKIDLVEYYGIQKEKLRKNILKEGKVLYDSRPGQRS